VNVFYYAGRSADGRLVRGTVEASSRDAAAGQLRARSLWLTSLESGDRPAGALTRLALRLRRPSPARATLFRSFATLIGAGISVRSAIEALLRQSDGSLKDALTAMASEVEAGAALSKAMEGNPAVFSRIAIAIVHAGEVGGTLEDALAVLADMEERERALRKRVGAALAYPAVVSATSAGLVLFLLAQTMPAFAAMFSSMHVPLPATTRLLIAVGSALHSPLPWMLLAAITAAAWTLAVRGRSSEAPWALAFDRMRLKVPLYGPIIAKAAAARFARGFGSLLRAGVDVAAALEAAIRVVDASVYRHGLREVLPALRGGEPLAPPLERSGLFDATFLQLFRAGEESGSIDAMLLRVAHHYELDVESALAGFTAVLEPILICVLGAAIGTIVASIIIPLYSMIGNIQ
jgi:type IV pilus assembly protein PilC